MGREEQFFSLADALLAAHLCAGQSELLDRLALQMVNVT
jgi:hypothetical protein